MAEGEAATRTIGEGDTPLAPTLASLFLRAMRRHDRSAVVLHREASRWRETPDWRFERHVIRLALFLRDRAALLPGERVAIVSSLRPELAVTELAAVSQGAACIVIDAELPPDQLSLALAAVTPAAVILERAAAAERIGSGHRMLVALDEKAREGCVWTEALDLGGTLDTPERAQAFRARAREVPGSAAALGSLIARDGAVRCQFIDHVEAVRRVETLWADRAPAKGDVTYVAGVGTVGARIALLAGIMDGLTRCAIGTPGSELSEISELRPKSVVASEEVQRQVRRAPPPAVPQQSSSWRIFDWLRGRREVGRRKQ